MATPVGGLWAYTIKAFHDSVFDLPEDFFERIDEGIDPETRDRLTAGFRFGGMITQTRTYAWLALVIGILFAIAAGLLGLMTPELHLVVLTIAGAWILAALLLYVYAYSVYLSHRQEIRGFLAFVQAARKSSLGRDLA